MAALLSMRGIDIGARCWRWEWGGRARPACRARLILAARSSLSSFPTPPATEPGTGRVTAGYPVPFPQLSLLRPVHQPGRVRHAPATQAECHVPTCSLAPSTRVYPQVPPSSNAMSSRAETACPLGPRPLRPAPPREPGDCSVVILIE